jgi:ATP-dependent exoDNAse (exonuclease V) beta subunit
MPRGDSATSQNFVKLLEDTLATDPLAAEFGGVPATVLYQSHTGKTNRRWFEAFHPSAAAESPAPGRVRRVDSALARKRVRRRTPSGSEEITVSAAQIFTPAGNVAREFGTLVHALFEEIEWRGETCFDVIAARWQGTRDMTTGLEDALGQVRGVLDDPVTGAALARPGENAEVWRERSFEVLLGDEWLSGTFDRVVLERTPAGVAERATILDFKTDRVETPDEIAAAVTKYRPQLETYREVLRRITGLSATAIRCRLLFTRSRSLRDI